ncbi:MAG: CapA family protein, partial [Fibrobacterota bacterium]
KILENIEKVKSVPIEKKCRDTLSCYAFRSPSSFALNLKEAGFDVMSGANNHAFDWGHEGYDSTSDALSAAGIHYTGKKGSYSVIEREGLKIGVAAFAPNNGTNPLNDYDFVKDMIKEMDEVCDIILVSFHGGAEGVSCMHVPDSMEIFYGEERGYLREFSRMVIDAGADAVIGHGPHVVRGIELYKKRLIAYSLGNFCTYEGINIKGIRGAAPLLVLSVSDEGAFLEGRIFSFIQKRPEGLQKDQSGAAARLIRRLSADDFPDTALLIGKDGSIKIR